MVRMRVGSLLVAGQAAGAAALSSTEGGSSGVMKVVKLLQETKDTLIAERKTQE